ncbi:SRPBCC family protein [Mycobacterium vicinigordonae]|uniref:SRPBCC family protein n=1 Tax=Mycobacterium vicinigordonae TaxID=1719132 RepID=A0A7D6IU81_9MYCO|nr:SRPBCC family protein [Mycobacterium vicinigordonae]QLL08979.1 SRPBCC family protein [Mycobacterium vicinigordonae]
MLIEHSFEIDASSEVVWEVFSDVERWPEWTESVTSLVALDGPGLALGKRFAIKQPRMGKLVWRVTEIEPGMSWTWEQRAPGALAKASHEVIPQPGGRTLVRQRIDQQGVLGALVGRLMTNMTKRYLDMEARGLTKRSEQRRGARGSRA